IRLDHQLRSIGSVEVPVKLYQDVAGEIKIYIQEA
ncbi:50S ribosomal protein L9, partial [Streptococcus danieliae]|nr:50S ribosomal protein L9 [Streptococcus danieliae]